MDFSIDYCWSGDYKGIFYDGRTCAEVVHQSPWLCYDAKYRDACCKSCFDIEDQTNDGMHSFGVITNMLSWSEVMSYIKTLLHTITFGTKMLHFVFQCVHMETRMNGVRGLRD